MILAKNYSHMKLTSPIWLTVKEENAIVREKIMEEEEQREEKLKKFDQDHMFLHLL